MFAKGATALCLALIMAGVTVSDADAQRRRNNNQEEDDGIDRTFSSAIGEIVLEAQNLQSAEPPQFAASIDVLNRALGREPSAYERTIILQMRGRAYYETDRIPNAIQDWEAAIAAGGMTPTEIGNLRINIGQLLIAEGQYARGIQSLEAALNTPGVERTPRLAKMLAQAYGQAERYREGLPHAEFYWNNTPAAERSRGDYSLMLFYYQQLENIPRQLEIVEAMVSRWPEDKNNWTSYASLLARVGREEDAFEVNKIMYINGMLTEGREIIRVAQYYSYYEYPYRGASILERELNAGRVERTQDNLNLLANMWRQSREWERAIPVLRQVAQLTGSGDDYAKLGEALYQLENRSEAAEAFAEALNRGGLDRPGDIWALLGTVRYELDQPNSAIEAFQQGARFPYSRRTSNGWVQFIRAEARARNQREALRQQILREECRLIVDNERRSAVILGEVDEEGRVTIEIPDRCEQWFNQYGEEIRTASAEQAAAEEGASEG